MKEGEKERGVTYVKAGKLDPFGNKAVKIRRHHLVGRTVVRLARPAFRW